MLGVAPVVAACAGGISNGRIRNRARSLRGVEVMGGVHSDAAAFLIGGPGVLRPSALYFFEQRLRAGPPPAFRHKGCGAGPGRHAGCRVRRAARFSYSRAPA